MEMYDAWMRVLLELACMVITNKEQNCFLGIESSNSK